MIREHTINPTITVLMETVGFHEDKIVRAIRSFIEQDYAKSKLLILNHHPSPLKLLNVPEDMFWRIEVVNIEDVFVRPVDQHENAICQIRTDCWTVLDDDDWLDTDHLSQLVHHWNAIDKRSDAPLQVCGQNHTAHYENEVKILSFKGEHVSLFERLTPDEVRWCFSRFPKEMIIGYDMWFAWNSYFDKRLFDGKPTYHWDRIGRHHSNHETNRSETAKEKFEIAANHWRIKLEARASELKPVNLNDS